MPQWQQILLRDWVVSESLGWFRATGGRDLWLHILIENVRPRAKLCAPAHHLRCCMYAAKGRHARTEPPMLLRKVNIIRASTACSVPIFFLRAPLVSGLVPVANWKRTMQIYIIFERALRESFFSTNNKTNCVPALSPRSAGHLFCSNECICLCCDPGDSIINLSAEEPLFFISFSHVFFFHPHTHSPDHVFASSTHMCVTSERRRGVR